MELVFLKNNGAGTWSYDNSTYLTSVTFSDIAAAAIVTEAEGISSNDNDTTLPTSAAVKDYVDANSGNSNLIKRFVCCNFLYFSVHSQWWL